MGLLKNDFFAHVCQTSDEPLGFEIIHAEGPYLLTRDGKRYLDMLSGMGVANIGHGRAEVLQAIRNQAKRYLHPMVYGELMMECQVRYAKRLAEVLPGGIDNIYFTNSGAEAVEGALKTARKYTGRKPIFSFTGCYHGDTLGALSCQSEAIYRQPYTPLVPEITALPWNEVAALQQITDKTAGVIIEPIQGEGGVRIPDDGFMQALRKRCTEAGALLIFDEVMTGFGRTGKLFAAEHWQIEPDLLVMAKALGGGLPLGAFAGPRHILRTLSENPPLAHVTTFGGHPLSCAAGLASLEIILKENLLQQARKIGEKLTRGLQHLLKQHSFLTGLRGKGCLIGLDFATEAHCKALTKGCLQKGLIVGWTLFHANTLRLAPPLILNDEQIDWTLKILQDVARAIEKEVM